MALALVWVGWPLTGAAQPPPPTPPPLPVPSAQPAPGLPTPQAEASASPSPSGAPSALPGASAGPSPSESPSPAASGPPSPTPLPGVPIRVDRARIGVVLGGAATVGVSGGSGPLTAQASFAGVVVRYDAATRTLFLSGRAAGRGTVTLSDALGDVASIDVLVAPAAGVVPNAVTVELAGSVSPQFAVSQIQAAITRVAQMQPGTSIALGAVNAPALRPGEVLDAQANVVLNGNGSYVDVQGTTNVHVSVDALPQLDPTVLFYSDDPEQLGALDDGVLFRGTIDAGRPARLYAYHVSTAGPARRLYLALQTAAGTSRVQILGALAGPSDAFSYVGHLSTLRYLLERAPQESYVVTVAPGVPFIVPIDPQALLPAQLVAAISDLRVLDGTPVDVAVVSASNGTDPATLLAQPEHPSDGHNRRGEFALTSVPPLALAFSVGGAEPTPFTVGVRFYANGQPVFPNLRPGGTALAGDYGVLRDVALSLTNPTAAAQNVYLYEQPGGGGVTTTIWFAGDPAPTQVLCVSDASTRYLVKQFTLAPGESRTVGGAYMTDGTSYFPLSFGLTATAPATAPPNGCGPKPAT